MLSSSSSLHLASLSASHLWLQTGEDNSPFTVVANRLGIEAAVWVLPGMTAYNNWRWNDSGSNHSSSKSKQCQLAKKKANKNTDVDNTSK